MLLYNILDGISLLTYKVPYMSSSNSTYGFLLVLVSQDQITGVLRYQVSLLQFKIRTILHKILPDLSLWSTQTYNDVTDRTVRVLVCISVSFEWGLSWRCGLRLWLTSSYVLGSFSIQGRNINLFITLYVLHKERSSSILCKIVRILNCKSGTW